ncbi:MAG: diadenylate cyclase CdaA [Lachnospiraceae bacterium]|nr:diadenylate cyclase CdaA [Lachnospiraceae bacterium]MCR4866160.1 diadenylate cyclase CdaA [Lachnospiraceae bacterium]
MEQFQHWFGDYVNNLHVPAAHVTDIIEILIIAFLVYQIMVWIRNTRAWALLKGVVVILVFIFIAYIFEMQTILWIVKSIVSIAVTGIIVVLQPELRKALEELGKKKFFGDIFRDSEEGGLFSDKTIKEIAKASVEMGKVRTGALIVVKQNDNLAEFERTGISVDAIVTSQLLINIFEHNTPLHDGAVIIDGDRISSATCYLPLSDNMMLSKELGTRHRAGVGMSEETDAMVIIVSEETGKISIAYKGNLERGLTVEEVEERLTSIQDKPVDEKKKKHRKVKDLKNGKKAD